MKKLIMIVLGLSLGMVAQAKNSGVKVATKKSKNLNKVVVQPVAKPGMYLNFQGPWKLKLTPSKGVKLKKTELGKQDLSGYVPTTPEEAKTPNKAKLKSNPPKFSFVAAGKGNVDYTATVFVCDIKGTECFREQHKGKFTVK